VARGRRCCVSYATAVRHKQSPRGRNPDETYRYHCARVRQQMKNAPTARFLAGLLYDLGQVLLFYLLLIPKLIVKLALRRPIRRENLIGGALILKAYCVNAPRFARIRAARDADFLSDEQMAVFKEQT